MIHSLEQSLEFVHWFEILIEWNEHSASLIRGGSGSSSRQNSLPTSELAFGLTAPDVDLLCVHPIILFLFQNKIVCLLTLEMSLMIGWSLSCTKRHFAFIVCFEPMDAGS